MIKIIRQFVLLILVLVVTLSCKPKLKFDPNKPMVFGRVDLHPISPLGKNFDITSPENCEIIYGPREGLSYSLAKVYENGIFFLNLEENLEIVGIDCFPNYPNRVPSYSFENLNLLYSDVIKEEGRKKFTYIGDLDILSLQGRALRNKNVITTGLIAASFTRHKITTSDKFSNSYKKARNILEKEFPNTDMSSSLVRNNFK